MGSIDFNKLWQNFLDTVTNHYTDFNGRVGRSQFWYYVLVEIVIMIGLSIVQNLLWTHVLTSLAGLALLLPNAGMGSRRLQDIGRSGVLVWAALIPAAILHVVSILTMLGGIVGALGFIAFFFTIGWLLAVVALAVGVALIYFYIQPGNPGPNAYGPVPPVFDPTMATPAAPTPPPSPPPA
jgi:uncharacterized membrane protein YhaH (DUF805 family)